MYSRPAGLSRGSGAIGTALTNAFFFGGSALDATKNGWIGGCKQTTVEANKRGLWSRSASRNRAPWSPVSGELMFGRQRSARIDDDKLARATVVYSATHRRPSFTRRIKK